MRKLKPVYQIGDLFTELVDCLTLSSGIVTCVKYEKLDKEYVYSILWNDMAMETELIESVIKWRVENGIFVYYKVVK